MASKSKDPDRSTGNTLPTRSMQTSRTLPVKRISKIVSNYTRRGSSKLAPMKKSTGKLIEYASLDEFSETNYNQSPSDELLLNSVRFSPPKAEISMISDKTTMAEEVFFLKKQLNLEKTKYAMLEKSYKELLDLFMMNEVNYKGRIAELELKNSGIQEEFVRKNEFEMLALRVLALENN